MLIHTGDPAMLLLPVVELSELGQVADRSIAGRQTRQRMRITARARPGDASIPEPLVVTELSRPARLRLRSAVTCPIDLPLTVLIGWLAMSERTIWL